jgi:hypothetical protein
MPSWLAAGRQAGGKVQFVRRVGRFSSLARGPMA